MDIQKLIEKIPQESRHFVIDYVEGMPSVLNKYVKMNIGRPEAFNQNVSQLHPYSTFTKYLPKVPTNDNPHTASIQSEYCIAREEIERMPMVLTLMRRYLVSLLDSEAYDYDTMIQVELGIIKLISYCDSYEEREAVAHIINTVIMDYKAKVYDFYTYMQLVDLLGLTDEKYSQIWILNTAICQAIEHCRSYADAHDLAVLIYTYMNEIGIIDGFYKYDLLSRYEWDLQYHKVDDELIETVKSNVEKFIHDGEKSTDVMGRFVYPERLESLAKDTTSPNIGIEISKTVYEHDGTIYVFKKGTPFLDNIDEVTRGIRLLNKDTIREYLDDNLAVIGFTFAITDNDYGHLVHNPDIQIGTACDEMTKTIKYICTYKNDVYVLFKFFMLRNSVYGICTTTEDSGGNRKIIQLDETTAHYYKYNSTI